MHRNKETLPNRYLIIPDTSRHTDGNHESWYRENYDQDSILSQNFELDQYKPMTNWQVFISMRLNLKINVTPIPNVGI